MTDTIRGIIEAAMPEKDLLDGFTGKGGLYLNNDEYGRFIATFDPEHALLMEAVVAAASGMCSECFEANDDCCGFSDCPMRALRPLASYRREHGYTE